MTFGEYFRFLRREHMLSQRDLADKINVSYTYISKIENDVFPPPSKETLEKIAKVFKMNNANELLVEAKIIPQENLDAIKDNKLLLEFLINLSPEEISNIKDISFKESNGSTKIELGY